ncbi:MAG: glycerate kinase [Caldilineales bacterium]|nr:glycerate kinase [Caldilineales bacterium]
MNDRLTPAMRSVLTAALAAVDPEQAVRAHLRLHNGRLHVADQVYDLDSYRRIIVLGAGKAGAPMAQAVETVLGERITDGCVVVKYGHEATTERVRIRQAAHPVPDQAGLDAGAEIVQLAGSAEPDDLVICLLSGGGSALLESLPAGISLADLRATTDLLLASGATINEMNALRKHLSLVKGGQLARAIAPATLITLVLSDVVGSPLDVIASGPTVPDQTTWADAWGVVERYQLGDRLPRPVHTRLQAGLVGDLPDTPKPGDVAFERVQTVIVADNAVAAAAAREEAERQGYDSLILSTFIEGEAASIARLAVALAREVQTHRRPVSPPACLILGGETTVSLGEDHGKGGRNQELALAAALLLDGMQGITVVSLATDGTDGPTDAAGGFADGDTMDSGRAIGLDAHAHLARHDAYPFLQATGNLLMTGPTRTNVNDLVFIFVESA